MNVVRGRLSDQAKARLQFALAARETGFEQGEGVAPLAGLFAGERILFRALQLRVNDQHLPGLPHGNGLWWVAEFPAKTVRGSEPDMSGRRERLGQRFQRPGLNDFRGPGLD